MNDNLWEIWQKEVQVAVETGGISRSVTHGVVSKTFVSVDSNVMSGLKLIVTPLVRVEQRNPFYTMRIQGPAILTKSVTMLVT